MDRDRANLQLVNRRLERKVKEMVMQMDDEQHSLQDQKDQVKTTNLPSHHTSLSESFVIVGLSGCACMRRVNSVVVYRG